MRRIGSFCRKPRHCAKYVCSNKVPVDHSAWKTHIAGGPLITQDTDSRINVNITAPDAACCITPFSLHSSFNDAAIGKNDIGRELTIFTLEKLHNASA